MIERYFCISDVKYCYFRVLLLHYHAPSCICCAHSCPADVSSRECSVKNAFGVSEYLKQYIFAISFRIAKEIINRLINYGCLSDVSTKFYTAYNNFLI